MPDRQGSGHSRPVHTALAERLARRLGPGPLADSLAGSLVGSPVLAQALVHRSWCAETVGEEPNERLEFLGDAVLGMVVTEHLYRSHPGMPEGQLAKTRAAVIDRETLAQVAADLGVGDGLLLGKGEDASGGRRKPSILADAMEAVIGAVYLEAGWATVATLVLDLLGDRMVEAAEGPGGRDYKTRLQELAARAFDELPEYEVSFEGPDHARRFFAVVSLGGAQRGRGEGGSKKQAEQAAARAAWAELSLARDSAPA